MSVDEIPEQENSFYNPNEEFNSNNNLTDQEFNYNSEANNNSGKESNKQKSGKISKLKKHKILIASGVGGFGLLAGLIIMLIFLASTLKIQYLMQNIENWQFASVTKDFADSVDQVINQNIDESINPPSTLESLKNKFTSGISDVKNSIKESTWGKLTALNPGDIIDNLEEQHGLTLLYKSNLLGNQLVGYKLDGKSVLIDGKKALVDNLLNDLDQIPEINSLGEIAKNVVYRDIVQATGGSYAGAILRDFSGQKAKNVSNQQQNEAIAAEEEAKQTANGELNNINPATPEIANANQEVATAEEEAASSIPNTIKALGDNGLTSNIINGIQSAYSSNLVQSLINPAYAVMLPVCIIYDSSVVNNNSSIANNMNEQQNTFDQFAAVADQQKQGSLNANNDTALNSAIQGYSNLLGNINNSNAIIRADGQSINTSAQGSPEAVGNIINQYNLLSIIGVPSLITTSLSGLCHVLLSPATTGVVVGLQLLDLFGSFSTDLASRATDQSIASYLKNILDQTFSKIIADNTTKEVGINTEQVASGTFIKFLNASKIIFGKSLPQVIAVSGASVLAKLIVMFDSGFSNGGILSGTTLSNQIDSGANLQAAQTERVQLFGAPLTPTGVAQQDVNNAQAVSLENSKLSLTNRLFSFANANSLISRLSLTLASIFDRSFFIKITSLITSILNPIKFFSTVFLFNGKAQAAINPIDQNYGNIQFGWTNQENQLINSSSSYLPLQNSLILQQSGQEDAIAQKYAICFGYNYNPNGDGSMDPLDPNGDLQPAYSNTQAGSIATLLASNDIQRNSSGEVLSSGYLCSPQNLGPNNDNGLVFRWRLALRYYTTMDSLSNIQNIN